MSNRNIPSQVDQCNNDGSSRVNHCGMPSDVYNVTHENNFENKRNDKVSRGRQRDKKQTAIPFPKLEEVNRDKTGGQSSQDGVRQSRDTNPNPYCLGDGYSDTSSDDKLNSDKSEVQPFKGKSKFVDEVDNIQKGLCLQNNDNGVKNKSCDGDYGMSRVSSNTIEDFNETVNHLCEEDDMYMQGDDEKESISADMNPCDLLQSSQGNVEPHYVQSYTSIAPYYLHPDNISPIPYYPQLAYENLTANYVQSYTTITPYSIHPDNISPIPYYPQLAYKSVTPRFVQLHHTIPTATYVSPTLTRPASTDVPSNRTTPPPSYGETGYSPTTPTYTPSTVTRPASTDVPSNRTTPPPSYEEIGRTSLAPPYMPLTLAMTVSTDVSPICTAPTPTYGLTGLTPYDTYVASTGTISPHLYVDACQYNIPFLPMYLPQDLSGAVSTFLESLKQTTPPTTADNAPAEIISGEIDKVFRFFTPRTPSISKTSKNRGGITVLDGPMGTALETMYNAVISRDTVGPLWAAALYGMSSDEITAKGVIVDWTGCESSKGKTGTQLIQSIHSKYINAGCKVISTATYQMRELSDDEDDEQNKEHCRKDANGQYHRMTCSDIVKEAVSAVSGAIFRSYDEEEENSSHICMSDDSKEDKSVVFKKTRSSGARRREIPFKNLHGLSLSDLSEGSGVDGHDHDNQTLHKVNNDDNHLSNSSEDEGYDTLVAGSLGPLGAFIGDGAEYTGEYDCYFGRKLVDLHDRAWKREHPPHQGVPSSITNDEVNGGKDNNLDEFRSGPSFATSSNCSSSIEIIPTYFTEDDYVKFHRPRIEAFFLHSSYDRANDVSSVNMSNYIYYKKDEDNGEKNDNGILSNSTIALNDNVTAFFPGLLQNNSVPPTRDSLPMTSTQMENTNTKGLVTASDEYSVVSDAIRALMNPVIDPVTSSAAEADVLEAVMQEFTDEQQISEETKDRGEKPSNLYEEGNAAPKIPLTDVSSHMSPFQHNPLEERMPVVDVFAFETFPRLDEAVAVAKYMTKHHPTTPYWISFTLKSPDPLTVKKRAPPVTANGELLLDVVKGLLSASTLPTIIMENYADSKELKNESKNDMSLSTKKPRVTKICNLIGIGCNCCDPSLVSSFLSYLRTENFNNIMIKYLIDQLIEMDAATGGKLGTKILTMEVKRNKSANKKKAKLKKKIMSNLRDVVMTTVTNSLKLSYIVYPNSGEVYVKAKYGPEASPGHWTVRRRNSARNGRSKVLRLAEDEWVPIVFGTRKYSKDTTDTTEPKNNESKDAVAIFQTSLVIGGCCRTTPEDIKGFDALRKRWK